MRGNSIELRLGITGPDTLQKTNYVVRQTFRTKFIKIQAPTSPGQLSEYFKQFHSLIIYLYVIYISHCLKVRSRKLVKIVMSNNNFWLMITDMLRQEMKITRSLWVGRCNGPRVKRNTWRNLMTTCPYRRSSLYIVNIERDLIKLVSNKVPDIYVM